MGRGDIRTKKGKIFAGSYGNSRPKPKAPAFVETEKVEKAEKKETPKKKAAAKKTTAKK